MSDLEKLKEYTERQFFRDALGVPEGAQVELKDLAQGEYHRNFLISFPTKYGNGSAAPVPDRKLVLRVNYGSQMHLLHQIEYEYQALKALEPSGRTPRPVFVDGSRKYFPQGILVMGFLPGRPLDYDRDMAEAAKALADIHSTPVPDPSFLVTGESPIHDILDECRDMFAVYEASELCDPRTAARIRPMMVLARRKADSLTDRSWQRVLINTELNNHNFIVDESGDVSVIDWEKPLWGDPAQDLGHMLAPTTTYWKTDKILTFEEAAQFADQYAEAAGSRIRLGRFLERLRTFLQVTCMRGVTWCSMAWVEYNRPGRELRNEYTYKKLKSYLSPDFLDALEDYMRSE